MLFELQRPEIDNTKLYGHFETIDTVISQQTKAYAHGWQWLVAVIIYFSCLITPVYLIVDKHAHHFRFFKKIFNEF